MQVTPHVRMALASFCWLLLTSGAPAWERSLAGGASFDGWTAVAPAADGDPLLAGQLGGELAGARLSRHGGAVLWTSELGAGRALALALDAAGGAVLAGRLDDSGRDLAVARLDARTGLLAWPAVFQRSGSASAFADEAAHGVALAPNGDVIAVGSVVGTGTGSDLAAFRLAGSDGSVVWERLVDGGATDFDGLHAVALDPAGDVFVAGFVTAAASGTVDAYVAKLDGDTGATLWDETAQGLVDEFDQLDVAATDAAGDVYVGGFLDDAGNGGQPTVLKLAGADGSELWRRSLPGVMSDDQGSVVDLRVDAGSVWVAGARSNTGTARDALVARLDAATGAIVWDVDLDGPASGDDAASALLLDGDGMPLVAGHLRGPAGDDAWLARLDPASGAIDWQETRAIGATEDRFSGIALAGSGRVVAAGYETPGVRDALAVARCADGADAGGAPSQAADCDGAANDADVCPFVADPGQADADGDGIGDACPAPALPLDLVADLDDAPAFSIDLDDVPGRGEIRLAVELARNRDVELASLCNGADLAALEQDDAPNLEQFAPIKADFADAKILPPESDDGEWVVPLFLYLTEDAFASPVERRASCFVQVRRGAGSTAPGGFTAELRTRTKPPAAGVQSFCSDPAICQTGAPSAENEAEYGEFIPEGADFQWRDSGDPALGSCVFLGGGDATSQPIAHVDAAQARGWNCCEWSYEAVEGDFPSGAGFSNFWVGATPEDTRPDGDLDGVLDRCDNCPGASTSTFFDRNPAQENSDAILAGDHCQCTDVDGSGETGGPATDLVDVVLIARIARGDRSVPAHDPARCQLGGSGDACSAGELAVLRGLLAAGQQPVDSCR